MRKARFAVALLVAPLTTPLVMFLSAVRDVPLPFSARGLLQAYQFYLPFAYLAEFIFGIPAWMIVQYYGIRSYWAFAAIGGIVGWIVTLVFGTCARTPLLMLLNPFSLEWITGGVLACIVAASSSAVLFRAIVIPDRRTQARRPVG